MSEKKNCWEYKKCGREPGGENVHELGICPVTIKMDLHGTNNGINGGRSCWVITGSMCGGKMQGTYAQKLGDCIKCDFYAMVVIEEGVRYESTKMIKKKIEDKKAESEMHGSVKHIQALGRLRPSWNKSR